jgi:RNA polymerase sigma factor (sigma-70 family)
MMISSRQLYEKFYTFLQVYPSLKWKVDPDLKKYLKILLSPTPQEDEAFWINIVSSQNPVRDEKFWLEVLLIIAHKNPSSLAKKCLLAYCDEVCFKSAIATWKRFQLTNSSWVNYFQIARVYIRQNDRFLKWFAKWDQTYLPYSYLITIISDIIMEIIRQGKEIERLSDWSLLRRTSKKALRQALINMGLRENGVKELVKLVLAFREVYTVTVTNHCQQLPPPTKSQWQDLASYCAECYQVNYEIAWMQSGLALCVQAIRKDKQLNTISLDAHEQGFNHVSLEAENNHQFNEKWLNSVQVSVFNRDENEEYCTYFSEIQSLVEMTISQLKPDAQKMLLLEYGLKLKQEAIAVEFEIDQSGISKKLKAYRKKILRELINWSQEQGAILNDDKVQQLSDVLKFFLPYYYQNNYLGKVLSEGLQKKPSQEINLLSYYYNGNHKNNKKSSKIVVKVDELRQYLIQHLHQWINQKHHLSHILGETQPQVNQLVESYLKDAPYAFLLVEQSSAKSKSIIEVK